MTNLEKYTNIFKEAFGINESQAVALKFQDISEWDSVGHMTLVAMLEEAFDIMLDTDDIIDLASFDIGKEILAKYDVVI